MNIAVSLTAPFAEADGNAAILIVGKENERRAALDPPETPLPIAPQQSLLDSYEFMLGETLGSAHLSYIDQAGTTQADTAEAKERWRISTNAQRQASVNELEPLPV